MAFVPSVSIVILSHRRHLMVEAWQSAVAQTAPDVQILVQYAERAWPEKLNEAVNASRGEFIVILCDDDLLDPTYVSRCLALAREGADIVYTDRRVWQDGTEPASGVHFRQHGEAFSGPDCYWIQHDLDGFRLGSSLPMTCLIRRSLWDRLDGHDPQMPHSDTEFWYRAVLAGAKCGYIPEPLFWYREHAAQSSRVNDQMLAFLYAFHRKHFATTGVRMDTAEVVGPHRVQATVLDAAERAALLSTGWTPNW